jgi:hypothetical protein
MIAYKQMSILQQSTIRNLEHITIKKKNTFCQEGYHRPDRLSFINHPLTALFGSKSVAIPGVNVFILDFFFVHIVCEARRL